MIFVSVVMGVYNGNVVHIKQAVDSILSQDFDDFEFIIVDDGSNTQVRNLLIHYSTNDNRVRLVTNNKNIGLTVSLNKGVAVASGKYIVRMDADDICYSGRLRMQYEFMEANTDVAMIGGMFDELVDGEIIKQRLRFISSYSSVKRNLIYFNTFCHSTIMMRKSIFIKEGGYDESFRYAQDYDLWLRLVSKYRIENLDVLFVLRRMDGSISVLIEQRQRWCAIRARWRAIVRGDYRGKNYMALLRAVVAYAVGKKGQSIYRKIMERL